MIEIKFRPDQYHQILFWFIRVIDSIENYDGTSLEKVREISDNDESVIDYFISLCKEEDRPWIEEHLFTLNSYISELNNQENISLKEYLDIIITDDLDAAIENSFGTKNNGLAHAMATVVNKADN
jgi:hypothetical protein